MTAGARRWVGRGVVAALLLAGAVAVTIGVAGGRRSHSAPPPITAPAQSGSAPVPRGARALPRSMPVRLDIPAIGVHSTLLRLGLNPDHTVQVPPLARDSRAGWYRYSPTPGQLGPAVILGHVDSARYGPGVFYRLGTLRRGEVVDVTRADGRVARFRVDRVAQFPKAQFPTAQVYGNVDHAALRLVTCGGTFDRSSGSYEDNIVVFAELI